MKLYLITDISKINIWLKFYLGDSDSAKVAGWHHNSMLVVWNIPTIPLADPLLPRNGVPFCSYFGSNGVTRSTHKDLDLSLLGPEYLKLDRGGLSGWPCLKWGIFGLFLFLILMVELLEHFTNWTEFANYFIPFNIQKLYILIRY